MSIWVNDNGTAKRRDAGGGSSGGASSLSELTDIELAESLATNDTLIWDSTKEKWVNKAGLLKDGSVTADKLNISGTLAQGVNNDIRGAYSSAFGSEHYTAAAAMRSHITGRGNESKYPNQSINGVYNKNKSDTLLEVGNGSSSSSTSNAFEVTDDGYIRTHNNDTKIAFGVDSEGNYGYIKDGADTVTPFKKAATGTATAADVLSGKTFSSAAGEDLEGSIVTRNADSEDISSSKTYSAGYYPNSWKVTAIPFIDPVGPSDVITASSYPDLNKEAEVSISLSPFSIDDLVFICIGGWVITTSNGYLRISDAPPTYSGLFDAVHLYSVLVDDNCLYFTGRVKSTTKYITVKGAKNNYGYSIVTINIVKMG